MMARAFPVEEAGPLSRAALSDDILHVSEQFAFSFQNAGTLRQGEIFTASIREREETPVPLGKVLVENAAEDRYIPPEKMEKWRYLKGAKRVQRRAANGHVYTFSEGSMAFPDSLENPGRTILTSEGTVNRSTHVVEDPATGRLRLLTPLEAERLQGFDDGWTDTGMSERMRFFCMGNALVVPMITRMGRVLDGIVEQEG